MKRFLILLAACCWVQSASADLESTVNDLIPKLASATVSERYGAWMQLQELASKSSQPGADADREALANVLCDKLTDDSVPQPARMWIIRQLEYIGGEESVNALAETLDGNDAELRECARRALEKNPAKRASVGLRTALKVSHETPWEIGLMNSLGQRRDTKAVVLIIPRLAKPETASAAARALGRIADPEAIDALWKNIQVKDAPDSLIIAAGELLKAKDEAGAKAIYEKLYTAGNLATARAAALSGLAKLDYAGTSGKIIESLSGSDAKLQHAALTIIGASGNSGSGTIETLWPNANSELKAKVLMALSNVPEKLALETAASEDANLRLAAIDALGRVGGSASVPVLFKFAGGNGKEKPAAMAALARITDVNSVRAMKALAANGEIPMRVLAIGALAARRDPDLVPQLLTYAQEPSQVIQEAAYAAFGRMGSDEVVGPLSQMVKANPTPEHMSALEAVCSRVKNREAASQKILDTLNLTDESIVALFLPSLSLVGGKQTLDIVTTMTVTEDAGVRDAAVRALANWVDYAASVKLLAFAGNTNVPLNQYVVAIQGIARLARSSENEPAEQRADLVDSGLKICRSPAEKKQLLAALADVPTAKSAQIIKGLLTDSELKNDAAMAGLGLAQNLWRTNRTQAKELAQAVVDADTSPEATQRAKRMLQR